MTSNKLAIFCTTKATLGHFKELHSSKVLKAPHLITFILSYRSLISYDITFLF